MIYLFSGTPGSGKSLDLARMVSSNNIHTPFIINFEMKVKHMDNIYTILDWERVNPVDLIDFSDKYFENHKFHEGAIKVIIDECQIYFNAREWNKINRMEWLKFFSNHRHFGYDIYLCCQFDRMIDRQVRSMIEFEYLHRKVNNLGWRGVFLRALTLSPTLFMVNKFYYPMKLPQGTHVFKYHRRYARCYDSYARAFVVGGGGSPRQTLGLESCTEQQKGGN